MAGTYTLEVTFPNRALAFVDAGGEYIEVCIMGRPRRLAIDVINAWDNATGSRSIPHTRAELRAQAPEWIRENAQYMSDYRMSVGLAP